MADEIVYKKITRKGHCHVRMIPQTAEVTIVGQNCFVSYSLRHLRIHEARKDFL